VFNLITKRVSDYDLRLVSLMVAIVVTFLFSLDQTGWAAVIHCPMVSFTVCHGTPFSDIIFAGPYDVTVLAGFGNDYIISTGTAIGIRGSIIYGDEGSDILIGSAGNDYLNGGRGNDKYDGREGADVIWEEPNIERSLVSNDDRISGGPGEDYIMSGEGSDTIYGGSGNNWIYPNAFSHRDFSYDFIDCGPRTDDHLFYTYSSDAETVRNCEDVDDRDR
jgi:RTX calcium-binding nonapeptide repeat (4 copies)